MAVKSKHDGGSLSLPFGRIRVPISHPDKLYWQEEGITKKMVVEYYQSIAGFILPYLKNRPQSLLRNPHGMAGPGFYHKDAGEDAPGWVKTWPVPSASSDKIIDYIVCNNRATLAYLNNLGCIELNPWHSTVRKPDQPDYLIIDLDPAHKNSFDQVMEVALVFHELFSRAGMECFCKTSGSRGLHLYVPAGKKYPYDLIRQFAHDVCLIVSEKLPGITTMERPLKKRGNRIYLDYLQNSKGQTVAGVYCLRPRPGATVSMPVYWNELKPGLKPADFTIHNALTRIKKVHSLFEGIFGRGFVLAAARKKLGI